MILNLTDLSDEPLQGQISRQIRAKILVGELPAGTSLPSIRALAREQHVSVITVQRAYEHLMHEKLIHSRRGKGFFVSQLPSDEKKKMARQRFSEKIKPIITDALAEGLRLHEIRDEVKILIKENTS